MTPRRRSAPPPNPFDPLDGPIADVIDLHGYRVDEARARVVAAVTRAHRRHRGELVHIITGKGRHSPEGPVLGTRIRTLLRGDLAPLIKAFGSDLDGGGYLVRLNLG